MPSDSHKEMDALYLLLRGEVTPYERDFLKSVWRISDWSVKQRAEYARIKSKYLKHASEMDDHDRSYHRKDSNAA